MRGIKQRSASEEWRSAKHFQRGEANPRYKGNRKYRVDTGRYEYKKWHRAVLEKDNFTCQECQQRGGRLQAHHIKPWAEFPELRFDVNNGKTVCEDCHLKIHGNTRKPATKECPQCGIRFRPRKGTSRFCSRKCSAAWQSIHRKKHHHDD